MSDVEKGNETSNNENAETTNSSPVGGNESTGGDSSDGNYNPEFVNKLKKEKENFRSETQKLRDQIAEMQKAQAEREEKELKEKEDWKTLYEKTKAENEALTGKLSSAEQLKVVSKKESEVKKELAKLGVKPEYADRAAKLVNLDSVKFDKETGVVYGAEVVAKTLSEDWPDLFGAGSTATVTQSAPNSPAPSGALSLEDWKRLPYDERKKREGDVMASAGVSVKR